LLKVLILKIFINQTVRKTWYLHKGGAHMGRRSTFSLNGPQV